jgi:hypothetical protein
VAASCERGAETWGSIGGDFLTERLLTSHEELRSMQLVIENTTVILFTKIQISSFAFDLLVPQALKAFKLSLVQQIMLITALT